VHHALFAGDARDRERDVSRGRGSLAERVLGGPVLWLGLALLTAFALAPFVWVFLTSLKTRTELYATPLQYLPRTATVTNYVDAWTSKLTPFSRFFANTFTSQTEMRTLSAGLLFMVGQYEIQWGQLSAGVMISTVPVAILFTYLQRHLIRGLSAGALKG